MKKMKSMLCLTLALTCMITTMTTFADPSTENVNGTKDSGYIVQTNLSQKYIPIRGIPVLSLEEELLKRASLNETEKNEAHKIIEDLKKHLKERDYDQVQKDYQALDRLVGNIPDEETVAEEQQRRDEEARLEYEEILAEEEKARLEYERQLKEEEEKMLQEEQRRKEEEERLIAEQQGRDEEARLEYEEILAEEEKARLEYERQLKEEEEKMLQEEQRRREEERLIAEQQKREEEERLEYERILAEEERARLEYEQQLEEQENEEQQNLEIVSLTKEEILTELTRESLKAQLKFIADRSYIAHKDMDGYMNSFDKMKEAQKANKEETAKKHAESIKMIIDYYVSFQ
ncbi:coiled-coil domain-containing protein [Anaeromicrobium sediminis]|uniref:DUF5667 domain-containing protein n=1 Tax=Anaeromicrobium sediminis TaxID=1478221 RepID=A0A267MJJ3_9FIRM|nr:hypothetical protein [Anaeromicrobium sediminis]PAB59045.1 hypothetical protein CCE28_12745 [Anaeromicrobium sediminis]